MKAAWRDGNRLELLENGEAYYPRLFGAIAAAREEVLVETFILFDDPVGRQFRDTASAAARRGVKVQLTIDGYGSADLPASFIAPMLDAGVRIHVYDPVPRRFGQRTHFFHRLHRKLVVVDRRLAFCGGINLSYDHLRASGAESKQDYALQIEGPVVADLRGAMLALLARRRRWRWPQRRPPAPMATHEGTATAALVVRDNRLHRTDIERLYRVGIRSAQREVVIANAYFFPGYRLLRELRRAARRGVRVQVILQGNPDLRLVRWATETLHDYLLRAGVRIYEYLERPMHAKVALIDDDWLTVGSSNLDPLSLFLNLEANLFARDRQTSAALRASLERLITEHSREIDPASARYRSPIRRLLGYLAYHLTRRLPRLAGWLPAHAPARATLAPPRARTGNPD
ncbi:cardiolipin synthase ClsB [Solimonas flava]|uniref:cardiolipin synthase ClsB n=1 Tax=Solimonas flava TaxID=415849 RepID=UPI000401F1B7|nr:cardiolipin synthase ClsB [Solimonas flava]